MTEYVEIILLILLYFQLSNAAFHSDCLNQPEPTKFVDGTCFLRASNEYTRADAIAFCAAKTIIGQSGRLPAVPRTGERLDAINELTSDVGSDGNFLTGFNC